MAIKKSSKGGESNTPSVPSKEPKQVEQSTFVAPVVTAYTIVRRGGGWSLGTVKIQGDQLVSAVFSEPDNKATALERFKIAVATTLISDDQ